MHRTPTWRVLVDGGFVSLSGVMAGFCGLISVLLGLMLVVALGLFVLVQFQSLPTGTWRWGRPGGNTVGTEVNTTYVAPSKTVISCETVSGAKTCHSTTTPLKREEARPDPVGGLLSWLDFLIYILPLAALTYGLSQASACFVNLARRRYFDRPTIRQLRNFALCGLIFLVVFPNVLAVETLIGHGVDAILNAFLPKGVTVNHSPGKTTMTLDELYIALPIVYALTLSVIAAVMAKAAALAEDHAQIV